ncbi:MAG: acyl-CoA desaturase, partial [Bacteroidota bacterium]
ILMAILIFFIAHWYLSLFTQTFFLHRYAAHKMFTMSKGWEKVFFILTYIFQGSSYLSPRAYGILHRLHHAHADTELDPHSPVVDDDPFKMMLRTRNIFVAIEEETMDIHPKYMKDLPDWRPFDTWASTRASRYIWGLIYIGFYVAFATQWWMFLLLPLHFFMGPIHGVIINWFAHKYGYRNFDTKDTSRNFLPVDLFMMGESYHNNHHTYGGRPNFGIRWHEFDPTYPVILLLNAVGVIKLKKYKDPVAV